MTDVQMKFSFVFMTFMNDFYTKTCLFHDGKKKELKKTANTQ